MQLCESGLASSDQPCERRMPLRGRSRHEEFVDAIQAGVQQKALDHAGLDEKYLK